MKRAAISLIVALVIGYPMMARAQWGTSAYGSDDTRNPYEYRDVDDAQMLRIVAYVMTPAGMALEWGFTRPLKYVATQTPIAPVLSGDKDHYYFGQHDNADLVPPGTFDSAPMNLSTAFEPSGPERPAGSHVDEALIPPLPPGQSALH